MRSWPTLRIASIACIAVWLVVPRSSFAASAPNVLMIAVDDLRPELGCYGVKNVETPNIDRLAKRGMTFLRAYCQQAVCNPSRTSLMTGLRPDTIGVTGNHTHFRSKRPDVVTLPQHFKRHGYHAQSIGKIYHGVFPDGASKTTWDTMGDPPSWSVPTTRFGPRYYYTEDGIRQAKQAYLKSYKPANPMPNEWTKKLVFGPMTEAPDVMDNVLYDGKVADAAVAALRSSKHAKKPFFLAVGFIKPHTPFVAPRKYWDLYDPTKIPLAETGELPKDAPRFAGHNSGEVRRYTDQPKRGPFMEKNRRRLKHGYYACISYIDAQVGRVLDELDRLKLTESTIVVLFGDHGWHLGEHGLWGKTTNFELDTRAPLIVSTPSMKAKGHQTRALVEFVDLFPTLADLAGLPVPDVLEGRSVKPILDNPDRKGKPAAFSQYPRGRLMGYSMRTDQWRYTEWIDRSTNQTTTRELYDHAKDPQETVNAVTDSRHAQLVAQLSKQLRSSVAIPRPESTTKNSSSTPTIGFETLSAGPFKKLTDRTGTWESNAGHATIHTQHHRSGKQCLRLLGGKNHQVVWTPKNTGKSVDRLDFWFERWTKRQPFDFRVEALVDGKWKTLQHDTKKAVVGSFRNHLSLELGKRMPTQFRFSSTTPARSGVMIDDLQLVRATPMRLVSVTSRQPMWPVLIRNEINPVLEIRVEVEGSRQPLSVSQIELSVKSPASLNDIEHVQILGTGTNGTLPARNVDSLAKTAKPFGSGQKANGRLIFKSDHPLLPGINRFFVSVKLKDNTDLSRRIDLRCASVKIGTNTVHPKQIGLQKGQRIGYAVRKSRDDGVHTCRIPGLVTTTQGTLIGVYDARNRSGGDLPGDIDVGMSRSTDGGRTWEPMRVIMDMGKGPKWRYDGIGDPAILVDRKTGTIWVAATWSHGNRSWFGSGPGLKPDETGQLMLVRSDDDGRTWSKPINITSQVKRPEWCFLLQGPGKGITMRDGTLVFAAQYQDTPTNKRLPRSTILYSKDHGKTWKIGTGAFDDTTEAQVVEIEPGVLMLNCRYNRESTRVVMTTRDMGKTWRTHPTSRRSLKEPRACMASLIDADREAGKDVGGWLLFSNPDSTRGRSHITIKASNDKGKTWPKQHRLLLDEGRGAGYSCMTMIDEKTVGILYEGSGAHLMFQRIPLNDIIRQRKPVSQPKKVSSLRLPQVFGNHMVLQTGSEIPVWGTARPGAKVTVTLAGERRTTTTDDNGNWIVRHAARKVSAKPIQMVVTANRETVAFRDVLIGEVWVCAGQSNMEWPLLQSTNGKQELAAAQHPTIRLLNLVGGARGSSGSYTLNHLARLSPEQFFQGNWEVASPEAAREFSAVAWYFGRHLREKLNVPIGLICPAVGGTPAEAWIPRDALQRDPHLKEMVVGNWLDNDLLGEFCRKRGTQNLLRAIQAGDRIPGDSLGPNHSFKPGFMWEAGIKPLIPYAIRGVIWYQGESNAESQGRVRQHGRLFPMLVKEWRARWGQGKFPFLCVQLPALRRDHWPLFRDQQRRLLNELDNVGLAITIDTGHPTNVHSTLKKPVGERLAKWALGTTYKRKESAVFSGPLFLRSDVKGESIVLSFDHVGTGLITIDDKPPRHFEICGRDGVFHPAVAKIVQKDAIAVSSPRVTRAKHARYAWQPYPDPGVNLVNGARLPASPFSTRNEEAEQPRSRVGNNRPNILLIVGEDHGCELSCYGDPVIKTPHIDRLATQGMLFENGYVTQSVCSPSRSTIFTGLYPHQNGQLGLATHGYRWFRKWPTTYSILKKSGYRTGLIGKTHILPLDAVEPFVDFRFQKKSNFGKKNVADYAVQAGRFFRASDKPFFMTVNYPDAHWPLQDKVDGLPTVPVDPKKLRVMPYVGGETPRLRKIARNYYNCMLRLDACVGQLLKQLKDSDKADNTLVIFIGDHGAQMARGKVTVYEGGMRVPFIARWPGVIKSGRRSRALVSTIDLLPTLTAAAGVATPKGLPGQSLRSVFEETNGESFRKYLACERNCDAARHTFPQRTIRDARYKLIYSPVRDREDPSARYYRVHGAVHWSGCLTDKELAGASLRTKAGYARWLNPPVFQLYDLQTDPHEWKDLANDPAHAATKAKLVAALKRWQTDTRDPLADPVKLRMLMAENDSVFKSKRRSPKSGWRYLKYLDTSTTDNAKRK